MNDRERYLDSGRTRPWLYVSGPMRGKWGDSPWINCKIGIDAASLAWKAGWHPVCPMLNGFWEMVIGALDPESTDGACGWLDYDFSFLTRCDALLRLPGSSEGADRECEVMIDAAKPCIHAGGIDRLAEVFPSPDDYLEYVGGLWIPKRSPLEGRARSEGVRW